MVSKLCGKCDKRSYSAASQGEWLCPYCGEDITHVLAEIGNPVSK
ncbi:MAG: hypothetical protein Q8N36_04515 [bacterium]|nr:hypothetical protein [bacterium]